MPGNRAITQQDIVVEPVNELSNSSEDHRSTARAHNMLDKPRSVTDADRLSGWW